MSNSISVPFVLAKGPPGSPGAQAISTSGSGSVSASSLSNQDFLNILDFGAVADGGLTDNASAIQWAIDVAGTSATAPKTIYFPPSGNFYGLARAVFCPYSGIRFLGHVPYAGNSLAPSSRSWIGQVDFAASHPGFVVSGNNGIMTGAGTDGPAISSGTYNGGTVYGARLNPSLGQLDDLGLHLSDTDLGDWQALTNAFSFDCIVRLVSGVTNNNTVVYMLTSSGAIGSTQLAFHSTVRIGIDNTGTNGLTTQNGIWVQVQTSNTQNGNALNAGVVVKSPPGSIVVGRWHHVRVVYDGAHVTISIDGAVATNGGSNPVALTGNLQQQWYEQVRVGGEAGTVLEPNSQQATLSTAKPDIPIDIASIRMFNYALPTTYTPPVGEQTFVNASGNNVCMFLISFAPGNFGTPPNWPSGAASPLAASFPGWVIAKSSYHSNLGVPPRAGTGSPVWLRWRGTLGASYSVGSTFENLSFGGQPNNGAPWCQSPVITQVTLQSLHKNCFYSGLVGPAWDVFAYQVTIERCQFSIVSGAIAWARAWSAQFGKGVQYVRVFGGGSAGGSWIFIGAEGLNVDGGFWNCGQLGTVLAGGGGNSVNLKNAAILNDAGINPSVTQVMCIDTTYIQDGGYIANFANTGVPCVSLVNVSRAHIRGQLQTSDDATGTVAILNSTPLDCTLDVDPLTGPVPPLYTFSPVDAKQGGLAKFGRGAAPSYDCTAGGAIAILNVDCVSEMILLTGTPAAGFQVQLPMLAMGQKIRFVNLTGQTATVYTQAPQWAANTRYGGFAVMTPTTANGKWYARNVDNTTLAKLAGFYPFGSDRLTGLQSNGVSGPTQPTWGTTVGGATSDGQSPTNLIGIVGCWWWCMGNVGGSSTRQAGTSVTVAAGAAVTAYCTGLGWVAA